MKNRQKEITKTIKVAIGIVFIFVMGLLLGRADESFAASVKDTKKQTVAPSSTQSKPGTSTSSSRSSRVNQMLQQIMQAQTLKQYNDLLKNANLTPSEQEELKKELAKPQYANKVKKLVQDAKTAAEADARSKANRKKQEIARKQQQNLTQLNQQAMEHHQSQISKLPGAAQAAKVPGGSTLPSGTAMKGPISLEGLPHIASVNPQPITPGRHTVGITGENFRKAGEPVGRVSLKIGRTSTDLPLITYSADVIGVRVPAEVSDIARREIPGVLEGGIIEGLLDVHTPRGTARATVQLNIPIDETQLTPKIGLVFPKEIQPGQRVSILGEKFLSREQGTVSFHFGSRSISATIIDWAPIGVLVELPSDISGMRRTVGTVEVRNYLGRSDTHNATFIPIEVTEELIGTLEHRCREHESWSGTELFFDFNLTNGWRVADRYLLDYSYGTGSCFEVRRPEFDSTNPLYEVRGSCSRGSRGFGADGCTCIGHVIIQGPRGLAYR